MKFGFVPVNIGMTDPRTLAGMARRVESLGYESVWTFEHVMVPVNYDSKYPYNKSGNMGAPPETPFVDPLIALTEVVLVGWTVRGRK